MNFYTFPLFSESIEVILLEIQEGGNNRFLVARSVSQLMTEIILVKIENISPGNGDTEHYYALRGMVEILKYSWQEQLSIEWNFSSNSDFFNRTTDGLKFFDGIRFKVKKNVTWVYF